MFYLFRLDIQDQEVVCTGLVPYWERQRWWYRLAQVCQRWRSTIFASPSRLDLHLLCTYGTPVADMLTHPPPLRLTIYYFHKRRMTTAEDEKGILLDLQHRDRVRHIRLSLPASLQKIFTAMDEQFPILGWMYIYSEHCINGDTKLALPSTFQAPPLRNVGLRVVALQIGSPLLTTLVNLVTLALKDIPSSAYSPQVIYSHGFHSCLSWRSSSSGFTPLSPAIMLSLNCQVHRSRHTSHFQT
jgi:hypothetical protein